MYIKEVFEKGLNSLTSEQPSSRNAQLACQQLKDFFNRGCRSVVAKLKEEWKTEKEFNCIVATEVLIPLSSGYCIINKKTPNVTEEKLKLPAENGVEGLAIGEKILLPSNNKLRHTRAHMALVQCQYSELTM